LERKNSIDNPLTIPTSYGCVEIGLSAPTEFALPDLRIFFDEDQRTITKIANDFIGGKVTPEQVKALVRISKLPRAYHSTLLKKFEEDPAAATKDAKALQRFERDGYQYFPAKNQFLVSDKTNFKEYLVVSFIDGSRAKCNMVWGADKVAKNLAKWLSAGEIGKSNSSSPEVTSVQADLVEKAIRELQLPYDKVGKIIRLISGFTAYRKQEQLFDRLETGFSEQEMLNLVKRVKERSADAERERRYSIAGNFKEPLFLKDTGELLLADSNFLINLSSDPPVIYRVVSLQSGIQIPNEIGRYIIRRKWSKHTELEKINNGDFVGQWWFSDWLKAPQQIKKTIQHIPDPYRARLNSLYDELLAHAIKRS